MEESVSISGRSGRTAASPAMYVSVSVLVPDSRTRGAPSNPAVRRWASSAWVAVRNGGPGRTTLSPPPTPRPWVAVPPGSTSVLGTEFALGQGQQGGGETRVGDKAMDEPSSDRGQHCGGLGGAVGDGQDERDLSQDWAARYNHPAVERRRHWLAVRAAEHAGQFGGDAERRERLAFGGGYCVVDGGQPRCPRANRHYGYRGRLHERASPG